MTSPLPEVRIAVIIPALNEQDAIGRVVADLPRDLIHDIIVVDNGSTDDTARRAEEAGARVVVESRRGYGQACLTGIAALDDQTTVVVFLDGDYSDDPTEASSVLAPLLANEADLVIGSRVLGRREAGSLTPQQRFGNALATLLIRWLYSEHYTDLGPFRAIRRDALERIGMIDKDFGWTVEMQVKAAREGLRSTEVPVSYRKRFAGQSKVAGTLMGSIRAGRKILTTIFRHAWSTTSAHTAKPT